MFASGGGLTYQWFGPGGAPLSDSAGEIEGATTATLRILDVQPGDAGDYRVRIANIGGSVASDLATLGELPVSALECDAYMLHMQT